jgi:dihydroorotase
MAVSTAPYELVLSGGTVIDPATGLNGRYDVAVSDGKIAAVEPDLSMAHAKKRIDVTGKSVTAGMIDTHAHVYEHVTGRFGLNPDMVVDQGGPSCMTIERSSNCTIRPFSMSRPTRSASSRP